MKIQNLKEAFILKMQALYDMENHIIKALPKMIKKANSSDLISALEEHLEETKRQAERLESIFISLGFVPKKLKGYAIRGIVDDAEWGMNLNAPPSIFDSMLIVSARHAEHYEMSGYLSGIAWAKILKYEEARSLLEESLREEENAERKLSALAERIDDEANMDNIE